MILLLLLLSATPTPPSTVGVRMRQNGVDAGIARTLNMVGSTVSCAIDVCTVTTTGGGSSDGGSSGAPTNAQYWVGASDATLTAEKNLGALSTALVVNTAGTPSAYAGSTCGAGSYASAASATGVLTCSVPPSGGGNTVAVTVAFGAGDTTASTVVTGQTWVTLASVITCTATLQAASGRAEGAEDAVIEGVTGGVHSRVAGTGFTLTVGKPGPGLLYGSFIFSCTGV